MANTTEKKKRTRYTSPKGSALFARVIDVDYGTEKYPDTKGSFNITLALDEPEAQRLESMLEEEVAEARVFADNAFAELKPQSQKKLGEVKFNELGPEEYDRDGNLTGRRLFRFKTGAFYEKNGKKLQRRVPLFDAMQQAVSLKEEPGNGSIIRVSFTCNPYFVEGQGMGGLSLYLDAVQIIKLNKAGERSASDYGFAAEEGGFCAAEDMDDDTITSTAEAPDTDTNTGAPDELPF